MQPGGAVVLAWADRHVGPISFDINVRPTVITEPADYWHRVEPWLEMLGRHGGIVKASDEDVAILAGVSGEPDPDDSMAVMARWQDRFGFATGVVTLGPDGAWARDATRPGDPIRVAGERVRVVDTVRAGDTFMAAFLAAVAGDAGVDQAVRHGVAAAAYVCTRQRPQPPTRAELDRFMTR